MWLPRLLLLLFFFHLLCSHIREPLYSDLFKGINLGFHEIGHVVFGPFGEFLTVAGGSIFQCLVPLLSTLMFWRQRDYFGIAVCFAWLSTNLFDVAVYADDARRLALPLVTPFKGGEEVIHDWNYMLDKTDMLQYDYVFAGGLRVFAVLSMLFCFVFGGWLIYNMMSLKKVGAEKDEESTRFLAQNPELQSLSYRQFQSTENGSLNRKEEKKEQEELVLDDRKDERTDEGRKGNYLDR